MKDSPIFFDFTQELHLIESCLIISLVCSEVPIHLEKINTLESKKSNNQTELHDDSKQRNLFIQLGYFRKSASLRNSAALRRPKARAGNYVPQ